jgi:hypothetical protein
MAAPDRVPMPAVARAALAPTPAPPDPAALMPTATYPDDAPPCRTDPPVPPAIQHAPLRVAWLTLWLALGVLLALLWRRRVPVAYRPATPATPQPAADASTSDPRSPAPDPRSHLPTLQHAITRRQALEIVYQAAEGAPTTRIIRPLRLEGHGDCWYLHAYCTLRRDERVFRVDRIGALRVVRVARRRGRPTRQERPAPAATPARPTRPRARAAPPRASFFAPPPTPPPGSPLVRVWLAD